MMTDYNVLVLNLHKLENKSRRDRLKVVARVIAAAVQTFQNFAYCDFRFPGRPDPVVNKQQSSISKRKVTDRISVLSRDPDARVI